MSIVPRDFFDDETLFNSFTQSLWDRFSSSSTFWNTSPFLGDIIPFSSSPLTSRSVPFSELAVETDGTISTRFNCSEIPEAYIFVADLPSSTSKDDVKVEVDEGVLQIRGESGGDVGGSFKWRFRLPENGKLHLVSSSLENGVLTVVVPKVEAGGVRPNRRNLMAKKFILPLVKSAKLVKKSTTPYVPIIPDNHLRPPKSNPIIKGFLKSNSTATGFSFFRELLRENPSAIDSYSLLFVLKACCTQTQLHYSSSFHGKQLHALAKKLGFDAVVFLGTCLIGLYSATGNLVDAQRVFDEMPSRNTVSWTCLISAYVDNHNPGKGIEVFRKMLSGNVEPDQVCLSVALAASADLGALGMGCWIHAYVRRHGNGLRTSTDVCLNNSLIDMYVKCGEIETARRLFDGMRQRDRDVTTWTSMIMGFALHGRVKEALGLFSEMTTQRNYETIKGDQNVSQKKQHNSSVVAPNDVTFLGVLMACSHGGMVEEGKMHFKTMIEEYGLKPREPHFGCMVDLLCRSGLVKEAYDFILGMPVQPNAVIWRTLLGACSLHGNSQLGVEVRRQLLALEPSQSQSQSHTGDDIALSNMFASKGLWIEKFMIRERVKHRRRSPGTSSC
ncbi:hypothetical protein Dimus_004929 [Dionaea muscipula]